MPFLLKVSIWGIGLYFVVIFFPFVSEVTYHKRSIHDVWQDWMRVVSRASVLFAIFTVASIVGRVLGLKGE